MPLLPWFNKKSSDADDKASSNLYRLTGMGVELAAAVLGMTLLGYLLDRWLSTSPWLLVSFAIMGIVGGTYNFLKAALRESGAAQKRWRTQHPHNTPTTPTTPTRTNSITPAGPAPKAGDETERQAPLPAEGSEGEGKRGDRADEGEDQHERR